MNIEKHRAFIESIEGEKGLPDEMHAWRFDEPLQPFDITMFMLRDGEGISKRAVAYLVERIRRAESRQIPDLKEQIKEFGRYCLAVGKREGEVYSVDYSAEYSELRALCEPEKDSQ